MEPGFHRAMTHWNPGFSTLRRRQPAHHKPHKPPSTSWLQHLGEDTFSYYLILVVFPGGIEAQAAVEAFRAC